MLMLPRQRAPLPWQRAPCDETVCLVENCSLDLSGGFFRRSFGNQLSSRSFHTHVIIDIVNMSTSSGVTPQLCRLTFNQWSHPAALMWRPCLKTPYADVCFRCSTRPSLHLLWFCSVCALPAGCLFFFKLITIGGIICNGPCMLFITVLRCITKAGSLTKRESQFVFPFLFVMCHCSSRQN